MRSMQISDNMGDVAWRQPTAEELAAEAAVTREMMERDPSIESWLRDVAVPAALALRADPSRALSVEQMREGLAEMRRRRGWAT